MNGNNHLEVVLGLLGLSDRLREAVAAIDAAGAHAVVSDPERFLAPIARDLLKASRRLLVLCESTAGEPPEVRA